MNRHALIHDLAFLTGPAAAGRLSGTPGAYAAARYLAAALEAAGFQPVAGQGYFQAVQVSAARLAGPPRLAVNGQDLAHRRDFAEQASLSGGGQADGRLIVAHEHDLLDARTLAGNVVLIPQRPEGFDLAQTVDFAASLGVAGLLVEYGEPAWFTKTVYGGRGPVPVLRVRRSLAQILAGMPGGKVELHLPLTAASLPCRNVVGLLRGADSRFTLALTAHYDHLGDDPGGPRFPGALDNASGVAAMLAAARVLAQHRPRFNLLVAFLTGEESGLWGARQLLAQPPAPLSAAINLDGIGSEPTLRALRLGHSQRGDWLADLAAGVLQAQGVQPQWISGSDDSSAFIAQGLPALGLGQQPTGQAPAVMHTPHDTLASLHLETINEGVELLLAIVQSISEVHPPPTEKDHVYAN